ncbi:nitroreductase family protein [Geotoga petraea]|uniref:Putative TM nitroreductase n=1 Tax=Geotoga petraea TaxID=28234 RepID=A0A1G6NPT8_9BACT|nr:nitroreductase family protein [Geotoga petraea]SDC69903.1 Putative TM nitroreductase [Geotoga petraea]
MNYIEAMKKRISVRKYEQKTYPSCAILKEKIKNLIPLNKNIKYRIDIVDKNTMMDLFKGIVGNYGKITSPNYLLISSEEKENYQMNCGFVGEQLALKLAYEGIGTCWIGGKIDKKLVNEKLGIEKNMTPQILMAVGYPKEKLTFKTDRKRKSLNRLIMSKETDKFDKIMDLVMLSPSAMNSQPWNFEILEDRIRVYENPGVMKKLLANHLNGFDIGIVLSHIYLATCEKFKTKPKIEKEEIEDKNYKMSVII